MASNKKVSEGTILLRQPEPKYKYVGRKLPKKTEQKMAEQTVLSTKEEISSVCPALSSKDITLPKYSQLGMDRKATSSGNKPVAVVEASVSSTAGKSSFRDSSSPHLSNTDVDTLTHSLYLGKETIKDNTTLSSSFGLSTPPFYNKYAPQTSLSLPNPCDDDEEQRETTVIESSAAAVALNNVTASILRERLDVAERERDRLKKDLDSQLQVNSELKRLLIASVGDDLSKRVERLAQDRVQLSMDIGGFSKKMNEDYENLDKISIQADMWRSKYLASRVMVEELGNARAYFALQWHESQEALQEMLNERHELRTNLLEAYKILQQVKDAFDPLNSHRSSSLPSTNVLDLSRACQQLGEAVRFRLLPAHVSGTHCVEIDMDSWDNCVTRAEQYAHQLLSRPSEPVGSLQSGSSSVLPLTASCGGTSFTSSSPSSPVIKRFHPHVKHENVSIHCCKCKGEIHVV